MRLRFSTLGFMIFALALTVAFGRDTKRGEVNQIVVHSPALDHNHVKDSADRQVSIYLPPGYDAESRLYPVLYLLHGYTGNDRGWMNPSYVGLPSIMDRLIQRHTIEPMIVVMPNGFKRLGGSL